MKRLLLATFAGMLALAGLQAGCCPQSRCPTPRCASRGQPTPRVAPAPRPRAKPKPTMVGSCSMLFHQYKKCKKMPLTEEAFVAMCDKLRDKPQTQMEIKCSARTDCAQFKKCVRVAEKRGRAIRMRKRWRLAMEKAKQGRYGSAMTFCEVWRDDLTAAVKAKCKALPAKAAAHLHADITRKRDAGKVRYKDVKCWDLKRYAKKAGPQQLKRAELLCKEVGLARDLISVTESVNKNLKKASPYLPYHCGERQLDKYRKIGSPYATKIVKQIIELCYRKLGRYILKKKLPKQKYACWVKDVYKGIRRYKIRSPVIDRLMRKAARRCRKRR